MKETKTSSTIAARAFILNPSLSSLIPHLSSLASSLALRLLMAYLSAIPFEQINYLGVAGRNREGAGRIRLCEAWEEL
jgi:hypothetical protein